MSGEKCCLASTARQRRSVSQHHPLGAYLRNRADPGVYKNKLVAGEVRGSSPLEMEKNMDAQQLQIGTSKSGVRSEMRPKREVPSLYLGFGKAKTSPEQQGQYNSEDNHPCSSETATAVESQAAVSGPTGVLGDPKEKTNTDPLAHTAKPEQHPKSLYRTGKKRLPRNTRVPHSRRPRSLVGEFVKNELQGYPRSRVLTHMGRHAFRLTDYSAEKEDYSREHAESFVPSSEYWGPGSSAGSQRHLTTMYFSGKKEQVKLHPASELQLPRSEFTVELWVKPEGGQNNPAIIAGGMVLNPSYFGTVGHTNTMIHELGHILGLYHVFKGVSERESCDDPCRETIPSLETGDLCADTAPTPKSKVCRDPDPVNDTCGPTLYQGTPFNNYMSYTDDDCTNSFTPNQVARMHCYLDLVYQTWVHSKKPAPIPVSPFVIAQSADSVSIHWLPPVSGVLHEREEGTICGDCDEEGTFRQYAHTATSPRVCDSSGYWTPEEAVGPPDVDEPCEPSLQAWSPELHLYDANMTVPCPQPQGCVLELNFLHPVIAESLSVWTTYISTDSSSAISNIEVLTDEGGPLQLGPLHTFCDVPLTLRINTRKKVTGVKIYTLDEKMEIDAVLLSSRTRDPLCSSCRPLRYRLLREPSFPQGPVTQTERTFTDMDVSPGQVYRYTVQVEAEQALSVPSPVLPYVHGAPYCGDGQVQRMRGEECDDGNLLDGDGCSKKCYKEAGFNCKGEPSQCYVFDGDGLCEEFERGSSVQDCGVFTPQGFTDQWVAKAFASHQDDTKCPVLAVKGEPSLNQVYFAHPEVATSVIIYLASDGSMLGDQSRKTVVIQLGDTNGKNHTLGSYQLSCQRNPLVINMTHNLSLPFFRTASVLLNFSSPLVAVSGIALRTSSHISALALNGCVRRSCSADKCSSPQIRQASVNCTHEEAQHLKCTIACNQGLTLQVVGGINLHPSQKETVLECMHGKWDRMVTCEPIDCGVPDQSHVYFASFSCPEGTMFGKQCSFSCNSPAKLQAGLAQAPMDEASGQIYLSLGPQSSGPE
ncbi:Pappalysin-2 [Acipenser ruthenus]|uniref:Pappalysin-2 n=1 Tax=Acipenser ruthenus TaxID=7906 RepID=A0A444UPL4_ACIRT|nr:Pappalysin-2 [Acipenser ruthenus]